MTERPAVGATNRGGQPSRSEANGLGRNGIETLGRSEQDAAIERSQPTCLVVEDDRTMRHLVVNYLEEHDIRAISATGRGEVAGLLANEDPSVVILDLRLGEDDGLEVLRRLREEDATLPVIMLTGHGTVEHAVQATRLGAYDFMLKPPDLEHLGIVVTRALDHARLQREVEHWRSGPQK